MVARELPKFRGVYPLGGAAFSYLLFFSENAARGDPWKAGQPAIGYSIAEFFCAIRERSLALWRTVQSFKTCNMYVYPFQFAVSNRVCMRLSMSGWDASFFIHSSLRR